MPPPLKDCSTRIAGTQAIGERLRGAAVKLEARLVDHRAEQHRVRRLHSLVGELRMVAARNQVEAADSVVAHVRMRNPVAEHQGIVRAELIIHPRADIGEPARRGEHAGERLVASVWRIERDGIGDRAVVHHVALRIQRERRLPGQRPAGVALELIQQKRRLRRRVRVARVPEIVGEVPLRRPVVLVGARLGEDLDLAVTQLVVLRRKWVLVDANLADRFLRRKLAAAETVDENRSAVRTGRRPRQRREVGRQIVRIVRKRVQIGAAQHYGAGIVGGIGGQRRPGRVLHGQLLRKRRHLQHQVQRMRSGPQRHLRGLGLRQVRR